VGSSPSVLRIREVRRHLEEALLLHRLLHEEAVPMGLCQSLLRLDKQLLPELLRLRAQNLKLLPLLLMLESLHIQTSQHHLHEIDLHLAHQLRPVLAHHLHQGLQKRLRMIKGQQNHDLACHLPLLVSGTSHLLLLLLPQQEAPCQLLHLVEM
jgi:hypothetical protein